MAYIITNKQYFFHTDFGVIQFLFKLTFFNPKTKRKTYTYLLESEYLEDPFLFTSHDNFDPSIYQDSQLLIKDFDKFTKPLVRFLKSEALNIDKESLLYFLFSETIKFEEEINTGCMPLYMKIRLDTK